MMMLCDLKTCKAPWAHDWLELLIILGMRLAAFCGIVKVIFGTTDKDDLYMQIVAIFLSCLDNKRVFPAERNTSAQSFLSCKN